jgi:N-acetylmuramoyl-L-alanine amidase
MNFCRRLALLLTLVLGVPTVQAAFINGRSYTTLSSWASANGFRLQARRGETVTYTNRSQTRVMLEKDSAVAYINGFKVALLFPVAVSSGSLLVAQLDLDKTIEPLVYAPVGQKKINTICIDPGHGGKDPGIRTGKLFAHYEKTYTLALAQELTTQLRAAGFTVISTRVKDQFVELEDRPKIANQRGADLFLSLHFNGTATSQSTVSGTETYCITPVGASSSNAGGRGASHGSTPANRVENRSLLLAYQVQKSLIRSLGTQDRGVRRARFAALRDAQMPAILIESGYLSHPTEGKKIMDSAYRKQMAAAIVRGVLNYQKLASAPAAPGGTATKTTAIKKTK